MKPNLPDKKVQAVLVDKYIDKSSRCLLESLDIKLFFTKEVSKISDITSTHPDMQFAFVSETEVAVCNELYEYYQSTLPMYNYIPVSGIKSPYPYDCKLNFTIIDNICFKSKYHFEVKKNIININQGYSKCNICILNENSFLTSDKGILLKASNYGFNTYYLDDCEISLNGYKNGFWGGCSGLIDRDKLFFNGNIESLSCYKDLLDILAKEKIEPIYSREAPLTDIGSIIPLY